MDANKKIYLNVRLTEKQKNNIDNYAKKNCLKLSEAIREIINIFFKK